MNWKIEMFLRFHLKCNQNLIITICSTFNSAVYFLVYMHHIYWTGLNYIVALYI